MIETKDESMSLLRDGHVIATARFRQHAEANSDGAWIASCHPGRLFMRNREITVAIRGHCARHRPAHRHCRLPAIITAPEARLSIIDRFQF